MKHFKKETRYLSVLTVKINQNVLDMMRYDRCVPYSEEDAHKIMRVDAGVGGSIDQLVRFLRLSANPDHASPRWASYGCTVLDERSPDDVQLTADQIVRLSKREDV